ncbi:MAG: recombinase family protein [Gemmataceae bacterium]
MPAAYGYIRFSSDQQEQGDSVRRQRELIAAWLKRNSGRVELDVSLGDRGLFIDQGMTGFAPTGQKRAALIDAYALCEFIRHVDNGRIPPGSFLLVESADRLSRESTVVAYNLITTILMKDIVVVTLSPEHEYRSDATFGGLITIGVTSDSAHDESKRKSDRSRANWEAKRAGAKVQPLTHTVPGWCRLVGAKKINNRLVGGEIKLIPTKAETVRRTFELARSGVGVRAIAIKFNKEGVPVVGRATKWSQSVVYKILSSRAVLGEYHPHTGRFGSKRKGRPDTRKPTGKVVVGYYPPVISEEDFQATQQAVAARAKFRGRRGKHLSLFAGLLVNARCGGTFTYRRAAGRPATLVPTDMGTNAPWTSFSADVFERAVLSRLAELKPSDVFPEKDVNGEVVSLGHQHAAKVARVAELRQEIGDDPALLRMFKDQLLQLDQEREALAGQLAAAQREAASPLSEAWGDFRGVVELLDRDGSEETRRRCREALRRLVEKVHCVFSGDRRMQFAGIQVRFVGGCCRNYLIAYEQKRAGGNGKGYSRPARWWVRSFAEADLGDELDLRQPSDAAAVAKILDALDPGAFVPDPEPALVG